jgi:predicted RNase H-like HicB family nuclease
MKDQTMPIASTIKVTAKITAVIHKEVGPPDGPGGYWAEVPALPGCFTQGDTLAELRRNIRAAVDLYLDEDPPKKANSKGRAPVSRKKV